MRLSIALITIVAFIAIPAAVAQQTVTTSWGGDAAITYDTGFMHMLMKHPSGGVCLFDMDLSENDAPGAGKSEKGVYSDIIWGQNRARKVLHLDDARAEKAFLVIFVYNGFTNPNTPAHPLRFTVNGRESRIDPWDFSKVREVYRWQEFPVEWLREGENVIELFCPEAGSEDEGWELHIARADEFVQGGGDPADVGKTSFKSMDGGETWKESPFGPLGNTRAEYTVRISFDRHVSSGWLASPVIDLWKGDSDALIVPLREIRSMKLSIRADVPEGTNVEYYFRRGLSPGPFADDWEPYRLIGEGERVDFEIGGIDLNRRYVQFRAVLTTDNPLRTPVIESAGVTAELLERVPLHDNIRVIGAENPTIAYSSIEWEWEKADRPEFAAIRERENLDEVVAGARTEFEAQVRLLDYVTKRWKHSNPEPEYPGWDALSILERTEYAGGGGMCIQFNNTLAGLCMAYGWQARLVNVVGHEVCEVWNDEYGKWIFLDADHENHYNYDPVTAEPLDLLEIHGYFLDYYFPDRPIDWMNDLIEWMAPIEGKEVPLKRGSLTDHPGTVLTGFNCSAFMRVIPRNNWYEKPFPRPVMHGRTWWPWDGYVNWYDDRTPPKRQYSWHTDRPRDIWPDLNLVHVDAVSGFGNDRLFLRFETYTPNFSHFEIDVDDTGWKALTGERWTWLLQSGKNRLRVRAVNQLGAKGKPSVFVLNHADAPFGVME